MGVYFLLGITVAGAAFLVLQFFRSATRAGGIDEVQNRQFAHKNARSVLHEQGMQDPAPPARRARHRNDARGAKKPWGW